MAYSRPRDRSPDDSYAYRSSSYYDRPSSYYDRPSGYHKRSSLNLAERRRAPEPVRSGHIQEKVVVVEEPGNPGVGKTIFRAGSVSEEAIIERAYPFKHEVRTDDVVGVLLLIPCREIQQSSYFHFRTPLLTIYSF
jgi:hypothetical protein